MAGTLAAGPASPRCSGSGMLTIAAHPLRREIIATILSNALVNRGDITFAFRAAEETRASIEQIARAYVIAREVFDMPAYFPQVEALDNVVPTTVQTRLYLEMRRLLDRTVRWFVTSRPAALDIASEIERYQPVVRSLASPAAGTARGFRSAPTGAQCCAAGG